MNTPIEIHFHGVDRSEAVEARIAEKVRTLERHFDRMTHCRVGIELPHQKKDKSRIFLVKLEIGVPGHQNVVVSSESEDDHSHEDINIALRDAFAKAKRLLDDVAAKMKSPAKRERDRRRPAGGRAED
jgi:ribosome-associated translation inhibitor RaiA